MGLKFAKGYSYRFHSISAKLDDKYTSNGDHRLLHFLAFCVILRKTLRYFEILTWESIGNTKV